MTIVVGFDDSGASRAALQVALGLATDLGDRVVVVYGVQPPGRVGDEYDAMKDAITELGQHAMARARDLGAQTGVSIEEVLIEAGAAE